MKIISAKLRTECCHRLVYAVSAASAAVEYAAWQLTAQEREKASFRETMDFLSGKQRSA